MLYYISKGRAGSKVKRLKRNVGGSGSPVCDVMTERRIIDRYNVEQVEERNT